MFNRLLLNTSSDFGVSAIHDPVKADIVDKIYEQTYVKMTNSGRLQTNIQRCDGVSFVYGTVH